MSDSIYNIRVKQINGEDIALSEYQDKVLLIVNTASKCGFTPQFAELEALYQQYKAQGFVVLGFPCNQFAKQDPADNSEILQFCEKNYGVSFPMFAKIDVNGANSHPLYQHLKSQAKGLLGSENVKWNFTKFLVNRQGEVVNRFASIKSPKDLSKTIEALL